MIVRCDYSVLHYLNYILSVSTSKLVEQYKLTSTMALLYYKK